MVQADLVDMFEVLGLREDVLVDASEDFLRLELLDLLDVIEVAPLAPVSADEFKHGIV